MPLSNDSIDLIVRYLNDPTDSILHDQIKEFRATSSENDIAFLEFEKLYHFSALAATLDEVDTKASAKRLKSNLQPNTNSSLKYWLSGIAASLFVVFFGYKVYERNSRETYLIKTTFAKQIDSVKLEDGSIIYLAENSEVKYPVKFKGESRNIYLSKGQAFFKIAKDKSRKFNVSINHSKITVLGTSFNVKLTDSTITLGVKTGKVLFTPHDNGVPTVLTEGQSITYDQVRKEIHNTISENQDSWLTKVLVFEDTPLEEVCRQLNEYYGVRIKINEDILRARKLNANFNNQSLQDVLLILNEIYDFEIKLE